MELTLRLYRGLRVSLIMLIAIVLIDSAYLLTLVDVDVLTESQVLEAGLLVFTTTLLSVAYVGCHAYDLKMFEIDAWRDGFITFYIRSLNVSLIFTYCLTGIILACSAVEFAALALEHRVPYGVVSACLLGCVPSMLVLIYVLNHYINKISNRLENECHGV